VSNELLDGVCVALRTLGFECHRARTYVDMACPHAIRLRSLLSTTPPPPSHSHLPPVSSCSYLRTQGVNWPQFTSHTGIYNDRPERHICVAEGVSPYAVLAHRLFPTNEAGGGGAGALMLVVLLQVRSHPNCNWSGSCVLFASCVVPRTLWTPSSPVASRPSPTTQRPWRRSVSRPRLLLGLRSHATHASVHPSCQVSTKLPTPASLTLLRFVTLTMK
jgi:hypothetical protein